MGGREHASGETAGAERANPRRALALLAGGAGLGLLMAAVGLLAPAGGERATLPDGVAAAVNGVLIQRGDYERLLTALESDSRNTVDAAKRQLVLDRMIEEELLVQRALQLGLAQSDRRVRADLTSSLIASIVSGAEDREPKLSELREFHREQRDFFTQPGRLRVRQILFRIPQSEREPEAYARAEAALEQLRRGRDFADVASEYGDSEVSPLPDALLPALKLREYVGPSVLRAVMNLAVGGLSEPVRSGVGLHVLELVEREPARTPALEEIESQVRSEWRRRSGDRALRVYLDELRSESDIVTHPEL